VNWYDILGTLGVAVIILTYAMLQLGQIRSEQLLYSILNTVGADPRFPLFRFQLPFRRGRGVLAADQSVWNR
jgi:hypothetical protein